MAATPRTLRDVPGPRGLPLLGNALQIRSMAVHHRLEAWGREFGPVFRFSIGSRQCLCISRPEDIDVVLRRRPDLFRRSARLERVITDIGFPGVFSANGDTWRKQRPMVMAGLAPTHVRDFMPTLVEVTRVFRRRWQESARLGREIDLLPELMRFTVDVTTSLAFGKNLRTLENGDDHPIQQHLNAIFPMLQRRLLAPIDIEHWIERPSARRHIDALRAAVMDFVATARQQVQRVPALRTKPRNLVQAMVVAGEAEGGLTDDDIAGNVFTMLLAGQDTTATTIAWMLWLLHQNPAALDRARAELVTVLDGADEASSFDQLLHMEYIQACAQEAMRLKPVAPMVVNQAAEDTTVAGVHIPAMTIVLCLMRPGGLDPAVASEPLAFEPQRWLGEGGAALKRVSMPFGAGPRICPGRYLAFAELKAAAAMILTNFDLRFDPAGPPPTEKFSFVMAPEGLRARLGIRTGEPAGDAPEALTGTSTQASAPVAPTCPVMR